MRLIDADELKKDIEQWFVKDKYYTNRWHNKIPKSEVYDVIDNAPTVEPCYQTTSCLDCKNYDKENHNCPRYCEVIKEAIKSRPQGEWIVVKQDNEGIHEIECPFCKYSKGSDFSSLITVTFDRIPPFCESCGANMHTDTGGKKE